MLVSEQRYRSLFDLVPIAVYACDAKGVILEYNRHAAKLWGREPHANGAREKFCGSHRIYYPDGRHMPHQHCPMARALRGEKLHEKDLEIIVEREDGERRHVMPAPKILKNRRGQIIGAINCLYDVTEHKLAQEALRESEEQNRAVIEQTTVGIARSDRSGHLTFANKPFCKMLGYTQSQLMGKPISTFTHTDDKARTSELFKRLIERGEPYELEKRYVRKDRSVLWVNVSASPVRNKRGQTKTVAAVVVDITARKKAEAALAKSRSALEDLVKRRTRALRGANLELENEIQRRKGLEGAILSISDREQQHLGQELHDGLCQQLAAIGLMAQATALRLKNHRVVRVEDIENITRLINDSVAAARNLARDLHKEEIDAAGFTRSLQDLSERKVWTTPCRFLLKTDIHIADDNVAAQLYRIVREAIVNANKHARARHVVLEVARSNNELVLSVTDDGVGFSKKMLRTRGLGFHIMQHRAQSIGARLEVESPRRGGARMVCRLPLS